MLGEDFVPIIPIKFKKVLPEAVVPQYMTEGAACVDIAAAESVSVLPNERRMVRTGLVVELPPMFCMLLFGRSGNWLNMGLRLGNCVGVIDSDYRGEIKILTYNEGDDMLHIKVGDRIAQAMVLPALRVAFVEEGQLSETDRGEGGFGSTDVFVTGTPSVVQR